MAHVCFYVYRSDREGVCWNACRAAAIFKDNGFSQHWIIDVCRMHVRDVVHFTCIVRRGPAGALAWESRVSRHADVVSLFLVYILW